MAASIVAIFAQRITHGTFNPHSECRLSSETSPFKPLLTALVTMITHSSLIRSAGCCTLTTTAGRSRKRGTSTNGKGTQTTSPARNCASVMIERLAISFACPFGKAAEIPHKRVGLCVGAGHDDMITIDFPHHLVTWLQAKRAAYRTRNRGLRLRSDFTEDHDRNVRIILTSGNVQSHRMPSGITGGLTPASASAHRAPGSSRSAGSAWARRHRQDAAPPCRHRSAQGYP